MQARAAACSCCSASAIVATAWAAASAGSSSAACARARQKQAGPVVPLRAAPPRPAHAWLLARSAWGLGQCDGGCSITRPSPGSSKQCCKPVLFGLGRCATHRFLQTLCLAALRPAEIHADAAALYHSLNLPMLCAHRSAALLGSRCPLSLVAWWLRGRARVRALHRPCGVRARPLLGACATGTTSCKIPWLTTQTKDTMLCLTCAASAGASCWEPAHWNQITV